VANRASGTVTYLNPASNRVVATIKVGGHPSAVAAATDGVWVTDADSGTVSRIDRYLR
jgi:YVTN family beta-propeller protein